MYLQLQFDLILTYIKATIDNNKNSIFSDSCHLESRAGLSNKLLKGDHPKTIPAKSGLN
jgi:hypothetical protein